MKCIDKVYYQIVLSLALIFTVTVTIQAGVVSPQLQSTLQDIAPESEISVIVTLSDRADIRQFKHKNRKLRRSLMIRALRGKAELTQAPCLAFLKNKKAKRVKKLWLINGIAFKAKARVVQRLATLPGIESIELDAVIQAPVTTLGASAQVEWNIDAIKASPLWDMGYTGQGIVVANMDTGVDWRHLDLQSKWRGGTNSWYDPYKLTTVPYDNAGQFATGHGTQTMGLMVGGVVAGTSIGVAHGAQWIAAKIFADSTGESSASVIFDCFQWILDPDGDPGTDDAPDVVNNSWKFGTYNICDETFRGVIQTLKAAGIAVVFAAGNEGGFGPSTSVSPANTPEGYATGSVDEFNNISFDSSRGPSICDNSIYPEVVAPGVNVKTTDATFGINLHAVNTVSGTSFAAPHVAGAMALLLNAFPDITIAELEFALQQSALDLGASGADNDFGFGLIDVAGAYNLISANTSNGMVAVGDINTNLSEDIAVLWTDPFSGSRDVYIKDGIDGTLIRKITFDTDYTSYGLVSIPDMNNNGYSEIGVLGVGVDTGSVKVQIKDAFTGNTIKWVRFSRFHTPRQVELVPDSDNNGVPELAVLGVDAITGSVRMQIRDLASNNLTNIPFSQIYTPYQFVVIPNIGGNAAPEIGVLGVDMATDKVRVQIKDALTGETIKWVPFSKYYSPQQMEVLPDSDNNGAPELAVLSVNVSTGSVRVQISDLLSNNLRNIPFSSPYTPSQFVIMPDTEGNGVSDIGVLGVHVNTGAVRVQIKDALNGASGELRGVPFNKGFALQKMIVVNDINNNNLSELAVLGKDRLTGNVQVQIKDSFSRAEIVKIPIP